jgi:hypothetical protein
MIHEQECNAAAQREASVPKPAARSAAFGTFDPLTIATTTSSHLPAQQSHAALLRRIGNDRSSTKRFLLHLQREYGNCHVQQVLASASRQTSVESGFATHSPTLMKARSEVPADRTSESPLLTKAAERTPGKRAPILRSGSSIPGTLNIENIDPPDVDAVLGLMHSVGRDSAGISADNADFRGQVGPRIESAIAANLNPRSIPFDFVETRGLNVHWSGNITFHMGPATPLSGGGTGGVARQAGGSATTTIQTGTASTDTGGLSGGVKAGDAKEGGEVSGGATAGTSTTTSQQTSTATTTTGGSSASTTNVLDRFRAPLIVIATVNGEPDFSGSDYINPFKWAFAGVGSLIVRGPKTGEITSGSVEFYRSAGIAPTPPATAGPPPVQRRSWIEHELGVPESGGQRATAMNGDYDFSRSGAQPLPPDARAAAEGHHRTSLNNVTLLRGGRSDAYCESMSAAAFCTPNSGGGSDIFVHSGVDLDTPQGQHTLQHEISHAVQFRRGETSQLEGLGGNETVRARLENHADQHADAIVAG